MMVHVNKRYVEAVTNGSLNRSGDLMDGILDIYNNLIQNVRTPFGNGDAIHKKNISTILYPNLVWQQVIKKMHSNI